MVLFPIQIKKAEEQEREQSLNRITTYASITEKLLLLRQMFGLVVLYYPIKGIGYIIEPVGFWFVSIVAPSILLSFTYIPLV
jgi:hypothetical protein